MKMLDFDDHLPGSLQSHGKALASSARDPKFESSLDNLFF